MRIKFDKDSLAAEQNNYFTKIVNVYVVYDIAACLRCHTYNNKFKNFRAPIILKKSDKENYVHSG